MNDCIVLNFKIFTDQNKALKCEFKNKINNWLNSVFYYEQAI